MLILTKNDMEKVFTMGEAIEAAKHGFRLYSQNKTVVPLRTHIGVPAHQGENLFMPSYIEDLNASGIKIVSVFPKNIEKGKPSINATMILLNGETGEVCCMLDGTYLTQLRTGALSGAATDVLARKDASRVAIFGAGGQAASQLEALLTVRVIEDIKIYDLSTERAEEFVDKMREKFHQYKTKIEVVQNVADALENADIITTVTTSKTPIFDSSMVKKGAHINAVGAYRPDMQEIHQDVILEAEKIFVDSREAILAEAGDFIIPIRNKAITEDIINGELGELLLDKSQGRETNEEITLFKTVGMAAQDLVIAERIYKKAIEAGIGTEISGL